MLRVRVGVGVRVTTTVAVGGVAAESRSSIGPIVVVDARDGLGPVRRVDRNRHRARGRTQPLAVLSQRRARLDGTDLQRRALGLGLGLALGLGLGLGLGPWLRLRLRLGLGVGSGLGLGHRPAAAHRATRPAQPMPSGTGRRQSRARGAACSWEAGDAPRASPDAPSRTTGPSASRPTHARWAPRPEQGGAGRAGWPRCAWSAPPPAAPAGAAW